MKSKAYSHFPSPLVQDIKAFGAQGIVTFVILECAGIRDEIWQAEYENAGHSLSSQSLIQLQPSSLSRIFCQSQFYFLQIFGTIRHNAHHLLAGDDMTQIVLASLSLTRWLALLKKGASCLSAQNLRPVSLTINLHSCRCTWAIWLNSWNVDKLDHSIKPLSFAVSCNITKFC